MLLQFIRKFKMGKNKYYPLTYIFENFEFKEMFDGYRLLKVGYSKNPEERLKCMPKANKCEILCITEGGLETERILKNFFGSEVVHPFYGYYNRVKVKAKPYYPIEWQDTKMYNYLDNLRIGMGRTGWGYSEWFIVKDLS